LLKPFFAARIRRRRPPSLFFEIEKHSSFLVCGDDALRIFNSVESLVP